MGNIVSLWRNVAPRRLTHGQSRVRVGVRLGLTALLAVVFSSPAYAQAGGGMDVPAVCDVGASSTIRVRTPADEPLPSPFVFVGQEICYSTELSASNPTGQPGSLPQCAFFLGHIDITVPGGAVHRVAGPGSNNPVNPIDDILCPSNFTSECQDAFVGYGVINSFLSNKACYTVQAAHILAQSDPITGCAAGRIAARSNYDDGRAFSGPSNDPSNPDGLPTVQKIDNVCLQVGGGISGLKYEDLNGNGVRDNGEPVLQGWTINLDRDCDGIIDQTTQTGVDGTYSFPTNPLGDHCISEVLQAGWAVTEPAAPGQCDPNAQAPCKKVTIGSVTPNVTNINFGNFRNGSITGQKINDLNGNAVRNDGEPTLAGWTICLDTVDKGCACDGSETNCTVTDGTGTFTFSNLGPGTYHICENLQAGWTRTFCSAPVTIDESNENVTGRDVGNFELGRLRGIKYHDRNANGSRQAGSEEVLAGWEICIAPPGTTGICAGGEAPCTTTNGAGEFEFTNLGPGSYFLCEVLQPGWKSTEKPGGANITTSGQIVTGLNFGNHQTIDVTVLKYNDLNSNGTQNDGEPFLAGWQICIDNDNDGFCEGDETVCQTTNANGEAIFTGLDPGNVSFCETLQAGWNRTQAPPNPITLTSGVAAGPFRFGNFERGALRGQKFHDLNADGVRDGGEPVLAGWQICLATPVGGTGVCPGGASPCTTTDAGGNYAFTDLGPGPHRLCEVLQSGWTNSVFPAGQPYTLTSGQEITGLDFGNYESCSISGQKFHDLNGNGVREDGEPFLNGWTICIDTNSNNTCNMGEPNQTTSGNGNFTFSNLQPGQEYCLAELQQSGWFQTASPGCFQCESGQAITGANFGNAQPTPTLTPPPIPVAGSPTSGAGLLLLGLLALSIAWMLHRAAGVNAGMGREA